MEKKTIVSVSASISRHFIAGLAVLLPLFLSFVILKFLLQKLDSILGPIFTQYIGFNIPGLGLISLILIIWFAGVVTTNFLGKQFIKLYEAIISKVPILNTIFSSIKQMSDSIFSGSKKTFSKVVIVKIPKSPITLFGFLPSDAFATYNKSGKKSKVFHVFIPTSPNPTTGFVILVHEKDLEIVDTPVEDGFKAIISLGVFHPTAYNVENLLKKDKK